MTATLLLLAATASPARPPGDHDLTRFGLLVNAKIDPSPGGPDELTFGGRTRVTFSDDATLMCAHGYLFHLPTQEAVGRVTGTHGWNTAALSPDGKHLAVAGPTWALWRVPPDQLPGGAAVNRGGLRLTPADEVKFDAPPQGLGEPLAAVAFSPDGRRLAGCSNGGAVGVWDSGTGKLLASARTGRAAERLAFVGGGTRLLIWSHHAKDTPVGWNLAAPAADPLADPFRGQRQNIKHVEVDPTGRRAAETVWGVGKKKEDHHVVMWDAAGGPAVVRVPDVEAVAPHPDGRAVAGVTKFGEVRVYPTGPGAAYRTILPAGALKGEGKVTSLAFAPGGRYLVLVVNDQRVLVFGPPGPAAGPGGAADPADGVGGLFPTAPGTRWVYEQKHGTQPYPLERAVGPEQTIDNLRCATIVATALVPQKNGKPPLRGGTANEYWTATSEGLKLVTPRRGEKASSPLTNALPHRPENAPLLVIPAGGRAARWKTETGHQLGEAALDCVAVEAEVDTPAGRRPGLLVTMTEVNPAGPPAVYRWWFARGVGLVKVHATTRTGEYLTELKAFQPGR